ncbi:MAG: T9SS type A sorting domain-containing protein [Ignavibacteriaceae bacterium]|nr:T9SS type A sorting domain-containing protein [Ignavibacteriaceae bacterium]
MKKLFTTTAVSIVFIFLFAGWGSTGHSIINSNITACFPSSMNFPSNWSATLTAHASDADNRKNSDPTESPKHFIDIENYPGFMTNGYISQSYDSTLTSLGLTFISEQGNLPWAIQWTEDSLVVAFKQANWTKAMLLSADLGHYVGDGHQPLHCTSNYDGKATNQRGVHSRYESDLVGGFQGYIVYTNDSASYVSNISNYVFDFIYLSHKYVDSTLYGDSVAHALDPTYSGTYIYKYWELCGNQIILLMKDASKSVADLIYTAWVDAGSPDPNAVSAVNSKQLSSSSFTLSQNYPNPFNPATSINYSIARKGNVTLKVFDLMGREVAVLVNGEKESGNYQANFDASKLSSGIYFYELRTDGFVQSKKMLLMK